MGKTEAQSARHLPRFIVTGAVAATIHWCTAVLASQHGMPALWANGVGFALAFVVSYLGQRNWTFSAQQLPHGRTFPRYLLTALLGFAGNESLLFLLLRFTPLSIPLSLGLTLVLVAGMTFLLSRHWVFVRH